jgi:hypothetical protein
MVVAMALLPSAWRAALRGERLSHAVSAAIGAVALGALAIGLDHERGSLARTASVVF